MGHNTIRKLFLFCLSIPDNVNISGKKKINPVSSLEQLPNPIDVHPAIGYRTDVCAAPGLEQLPQEVRNSRRSQGASTVFRDTVLSPPHTTASPKLQSSRDCRKQVDVLPHLWVPSLTGTGFLQDRRSNA